MRLRHGEARHGTTEATGVRDDGGGLARDCTWREREGRKELACLHIGKIFSSIVDLPKNSIRGGFSQKQLRERKRGYRSG